ncbi:hypothetical protein H0I54_06965 [Yersinia kristensenii]|uniref:hypothetical protein n=1 Tax=Yersinia kristensenii TaxID=28152 RepID=UPI001C60A700|nr:hypothetical protein [Yersinia kristensenii]MBW5816668.1 hypothetical protein [Yersinia kristensenii]MBW5841553.1 hypothetical protein [Yersinia kristensenii]
MPKSWEGSNLTNMLLLGSVRGGGQTSVPLTWLLCSNGSGLKGIGTAQATATLNYP